MSQLRNPKRSRDAQTALYKEWIVGAFVELARLVPLSKISVTMIAEKAGVSRQTFHRHFESLDDVVSWHFSRVLGAFLESTDTNPGLTHSPAVSAGTKPIPNKSRNIPAHASSERETLRRNIELTIRLADENAQFIEAVSKCFGDTLFIQMISSAAETIFAHPSERDEKSSARYMRAYFAGGLALALLEWIRSDREMPKQELAKTLESCITADSDFSRAIGQSRIHAG